MGLVMSNWISVKERLPKEGEYWVCRKGLSKACIDYYNTNKKHRIGWGGDGFTVKGYKDSGFMGDVHPITHWQPYIIPELPKELQQ